MCGRMLCGAGHFYGFWGGLLWIAVFAGFIALVAWAVARLVAHDHGVAGRPFASPPPAPGPGGWVNPMDDALNVARMRYARGELDRDQYFRVVEDLTGQRAPAGPGPASPPPPYPAPAYPEPPAPPTATEPPGEPPAAGPSAEPPAAG